MIGDPWPIYELSYRDESGAQKHMPLPVTIADWAASEARFAKHFSKLDRSSQGEDIVPFHEYMELSKEERVGKRPFVYILDSEQRLDRLVASPEIVDLTEERLAFWSDLKEMAGIDANPRVREDFAAELRREYEERESVLRSHFEAKLSEQGAEHTQETVKRIVTSLFAEVGASDAVPTSVSEAGEAEEALPADPS